MYARLRVIIHAINHSYEMRNYLTSQPRNIHVGLSVPPSHSGVYTSEGPQCSQNY